MIGSVWTWARPCLAALPLLCSAGAAPVADADPEAEILEERIVVTATRRAADPFLVPYSVELLDGDEIALRKASRSVPEIFSKLPGVLAQKTSYGQGSPFIRGFTGLHTVFLVDGVRINHAALRPGPNQYWATVDPLSFQRLELVRGPSSVLYGSEAVGGTVQTLSPTLLSATNDADWTGEVYYRYGSAATASVGRLKTVRRLTERLAVAFGGSLKYYGDLEAGGATGLQPNTGYDESFADFKLARTLSDKLTLTAAYQRVRQNDVPRTHKTIFARSYEGTTIGNERRRDLDQARELTYVQLEGRDLGRKLRSAKLSLSHQLHQERRDRLRAKGGGGDLQGFDVHSWGFYGQFESPSRIGTLTYGFELYRDAVDSFRRNLDDAGNLTGVAIQGPVADDASYDLLGLYLQNETALGPRLGLIAGLRYTYARVAADKIDLDGEVGSISDRWDAVVLNARTLYRLSETWNVFGGLSQGFRAPNLGDLTRRDDTSALEVPSPDLQPEYFLSAEIGAKHAGSRASAQMAYWYTWIDDLIVQSPTGNTVDGTPVVRKDNVGEGYVHGFELAGSVDLTSRLSLFGNVSWMYGEVDQLDEAGGVAKVRAPLSRLMPATWNLGAKLRRGRGWFEVVATVADEQDELALRDIADTSRIPPGGTPGYESIDVRGGLALSERLRASVAIENLTDEDYRIHGSGQNERGRELVATASLTF